jgi:phage terminase large subunit-like protein
MDWHRPPPPLHWWVVSPNLPSESEVPRGEDAPILKKFYEWVPEYGRTCNWGIKKFYRKDKILVIRSDKGIESVVNFKSHDQEKGKFKSEDLDGVGWDEEPPKGLWEEAAPRILDRKGVFLLAMTPDYGSWTFTLRAKEKQNPLFIFAEMDSMDNPFLSEEAKEKIFGAMSEEQRLMRQKGIHVQFRGKVFPFDYEKHVGKPFKPDNSTANYVIIDWHPVKPIIITYLSINATGIWYVWDESVDNSKDIDHSAQEIWSKIKQQNFNLKIKKFVIDPLAQIKQVQDKGRMAKSIIDMLRIQGIRCEPGDDQFPSAHTWIVNKFNLREIYFDPKCVVHIEQFDTWGAKRFLRGNNEGTLRDQLETEGNDTCINLVYAYNSGAKWSDTSWEEREDEWIPPRPATQRLYGRMR